MNRVLSDRSVNWSRVSKYTPLPQNGNDYTKLAMLQLKVHTGDSRKHLPTDLATKVTSSKSSSGWTVPKYRSNSVYTSSCKRHRTVQYEVSRSLSQLATRHSREHMLSVVGPDVQVE